MSTDPNTPAAPDEADGPAPMDPAELEQGVAIDLDSVLGPAKTLHAGFIGLIGRPNAGKSTLLNQVLGTKLAITSDKPQTTRNRIAGVYTTDSMQVVLVDTPGIHAAKARLNRAMVQVASAVMEEVDALCWVIDIVPLADRASKGRDVLDKGLAAIARMIESGPSRPLLIVLNKVDRVHKPHLLPVLAQLGERFPTATLIPHSALKGKSTERLEEAWAAVLPEGPPLFPEDTLTDVSERFMVSEIIREKVFRSTSKEVPYSTAVEIEKWEERDALEDGRRGVIVVYARIIVERMGQKQIVVGKGGRVIRHIGIEARKETERLLDTRVHLQLHVVVEPGWSNSTRMLRELGIG